MREYPLGAMDYLFLRGNLPPIKLVIHLEKVVDPNQFLNAKKTWLDMYPRLRTRIIPKGKHNCVFRVEGMNSADSRSVVKHVLGAPVVSFELVSKKTLRLSFSHLLGDLKTCKFYLNQFGKIFSNQDGASPVDHDIGTDQSSSEAELARFGYKLDSDPYIFETALEKTLHMKSHLERSPLDWMSSFLIKNRRLGSSHLGKNFFVRVPVDTRQKETKPKLGNFIVDATTFIDPEAMNEPKKVKAHLREKVRQCNGHSKTELELSLNHLRRQKGWQIFENLRHPGLRLVSTQTDAITERLLGPMRVRTYQADLPEKNSIFFYPDEKKCEVKTYL